MVAVTSLALALTVFTGVSSASAISKRQGTGTECASACGSAVTISKSPEPCASDVFLNQYASCLLCAGIFDIWEQFASDLTSTGTACGLPTKPVVGFPGFPEPEPGQEPDPEPNTPTDPSNPTAIPSETGSTPTGQPATSDSVSQTEGIPSESTAVTFAPITRTTAAIITSGTSTFTSTIVATQVPILTTITTQIIDGPSTFTATITTTWCPPVETAGHSTTAPWITSQVGGGQYPPASTIAASGGFLGTGSGPAPTRPAQFTGAASTIRVLGAGAVGGALLALML